MTKIHLTLMVQDPTVSGLDKISEGWEGAEDTHYLDGPVCPRVAIVDLDPDTEANVPGAVFHPPDAGHKLGRYEIDASQPESPRFIQVSAFGTVLRTVEMYEDPDALGRKVSWGFGGPQLLVVPRAGWWENAFYERRSKSLQFFSFESGGQLVHTALSRDIVAHETAHALVDGVAPDLYDALDPQSLAIHEGVADITAMLVAFRSWRLVPAVLAKTNGSIKNSTEFSSIANQFGDALAGTGHHGPLRNLLNGAKLDPGHDPADEPEVHALSQVLSGALYAFAVRLHEAEKHELAVERGKTDFEVSGEALFKAGERLKRLVIRGLDYLPPGEVAFVDYARAMLAADTALHPDDPLCAWLREEFVRRGIAASVADLHVDINVENEAIAQADLQGIIDSDWVAYTFADRNRALLAIPDDAQLQVLPRQLVTKVFYPSGSREAVPIRELLFRARWSETEPDASGLDGADRRRYQTGTTLVIDWDNKRIRACMRPFDLAARKAVRDAAVRRLMARGLVNVTPPLGPSEASRTIGSGIDAVVTNGILRVHNTARQLHVAMVATDE